MNIRKLIYVMMVVGGFFSLPGCLPDKTEGIAHQPAPSRYSLITADKVLQENDPHPPILHNDGWDTPHPINGAVNSAGLEDSPFISPGGNTLFLFFTPSADVPAEKQISDRVTGIYFSEKLGEIWSEPERVILSEDDEITLDGCPFFLNGILWFCSIRKGNFRDIDMWSAELSEDGWVHIANAGSYLNQTIKIGEMHISPDGNTLYYHTPDDENRNGYDLWQVQRDAESWGAPKKIEVLNSPLDDSHPALSPDAQELWFTRTLKGTPAIYRSKKDNGKWGEPELIISQFAGEPTIDMDGNIYFTHHFFQEGKMIEADIYIAEVKRH